MVFRNFLRNNFFPGRIPTWSETVIQWDFSPFWAAGAIPGLGQQQKTTISQYWDPEAEKKRYRAVRDGCPQLSLQFTFRRTRPPVAGKHKIRGFRAILA